MRSRLFISLLMVIFCLLIAVPVKIAGAESLWSAESTSANLFADRKAHAVGDIITIIISETSSATRSGKASNTKKTSASVGGASSAALGFLNFKDVLSGDSSDSFASDGTITNSNKVSGQLTVKVVEIKPNGNMAISGTQKIKQNGEEQKIIISGVVRPEDVTYNNTVLSSYVADADIKIDGKGPLSDKQRQGILTQLFNFIW